MKLTEETKKKIEDEYNSWKESQYNGNDKDIRKSLGQFYTPAVLSIQMIEKFDSLEGTVLDPTVGAGGLLAAAIIAGANPKKCYGIELDKSILENVTIPRLAKLGVPKENLHWGNALNPDCYKFDNRKYEFIPNEGKFGKVKFDGIGSGILDF